jgi:hypothetical protein
MSKGKTKMEIYGNLWKFIAGTPFWAWGLASKPSHLNLQI